MLHLYHMDVLWLTLADVARGLYFPRKNGHAILGFL